MGITGIFPQSMRAPTGPAPSGAFTATLIHHPDAGAVIHVHSPLATTMARLHQDIPPFHYMIAVAASDCIRCAPYALFGTRQLSDLALGCDDRTECLPMQHGMLAIGRDLKHALSVAIEVEDLCEQY